MVGNRVADAHVFFVPLCEVGDALGGGLDIKLNRIMSVRPIGVDLQYSRLQQLRAPQENKSQYNFRYSAGINFTFGGAQ